MKKYLYFLFVALFATMSFALTSCGDDDEPNDPTTGNGNSALTIDGTKYSFEYWNSRIFERYDNAQRLNAIFVMRTDNILLLQSMIGMRPQLAQCSQMVMILPFGGMALKMTLVAI